jgi:hypothetical protein
LSRFARDGRPQAGSASDKIRMAEALGVIEYVICTSFALRCRARTRSSCFFVKPEVIFALKTADWLIEMGSKAVKCRSVGNFLPVPFAAHRDPPHCANRLGKALQRAQVLRLVALHGDFMDGNGR